MHIKEVFSCRKVRLHTSFFYCTAALAWDIVVVRVIILPKVFLALDADIGHAGPADLSLNDDVFDDIDNVGLFLFSGYILLLDIILSHFYANKI